MKDKTIDTQEESLINISVEDVENHESEGEESICEIINEMFEMLQIEAGDADLNSEPFKDKLDELIDAITSFVAENLISADAYNKINPKLRELVSASGWLTGDSVSETLVPDNIYQAVFECDVDQVKQLISEGENPDQSIEINGVAGLTPLMFAAEYSTMDVVKLLIEHGANINVVTTEHGYTPLIWALKGSNENIARYLIAEGANIEPHAEREADWSPLTMAASHHLVDIAALMLNKGSNPDWVGVGGVTALKHVVNQPENAKGIELVKLLLQNKADPNLADDEGFCPIHNAINENNIEIVKLLLLNGVPANLYFSEDSSEYGSLLRRACNSGNPEMVKIILDQLSDNDLTEDQKHIFLPLPGEELPKMVLDGELELITSTFLHAIENYEDNLGVKDDLAEIMELVSQRGIKPEFFAVLIAFLRPGLADTILPYCKQEMQAVLDEQPELILDLFRSIEDSAVDDLNYFVSIEDMWDSACQSMQDCGIKIPENARDSIKNCVTTYH